MMESQAKAIKSLNSRTKSRKKKNEMKNDQKFFPWIKVSLKFSSLFASLHEKLIGQLHLSIFLIYSRRIFSGTNQTNNYYRRRL